MSATNGASPGRQKQEISPAVNDGDRDEGAPGNHGQRQYRRRNVTTNGVESAFAVLKRGIIGVYHHTSKKHLGRYVDEFAFRLNEGNVSRHTIERLDSLVLAAAGKRLTYQGLIQ